MVETQSLRLAKLFSTRRAAAEEEVRLVQETAHLAVLAAVRAVVIMRLTSAQAARERPAKASPAAMPPTEPWAAAAARAGLEETAQPRKALELPEASEEAQILPERMSITPAAAVAAVRNISVTARKLYTLPDGRNEYEAEAGVDGLGGGGGGANNFPDDKQGRPGGRGTVIIRVMKNSGFILMVR